MRKPCPTCVRRALTLPEVIIVIIAVAILIGLLLLATGRAKEASARTQSQNNLKMIGITMANYASGNEGRLPLVGPDFFSDRLATARGYPLEGLATYTCGGFTLFQAPLDPNLGTLGPNARNALSYALPHSWQRDPFFGRLHIEDSFKIRGTSNSVGCAEATCGTWGTKLVSGTPVLYDSEVGPDPAPVPLAPWNGHANAFSVSGCQVAMMDGSVRNVSAKQGLDFIRCSEPQNKEEPSRGW